MTKKGKNPKAEAEAAKALKPLIKYAQRNRGTVSTVAARLSKLTGNNVHRQIVEKWLHHEPSKRTEPLFGMGLLLMKVATELIPEGCDKCPSCGKKRLKGESRTGLFCNRETCPGNIEANKSYAATHKP